jgi:hypothetical protein
MTSYPLLGVKEGIKERSRVDLKKPEGVSRR